MAAIIYTRFSPGADADESRSGEVQKGLCVEYCKTHGLVVSDVFADEAKSGSDERRLALWQAVDALKKGDVLVVYNRDRLARSVYLAELLRREIEKRGATIAAVTGDIIGDEPEAVLIRQVLAAVAEYERKLISRRTATHMRELQQKGFAVNGNPPYGWRIENKRLIKDEREQATLAKMKDLRQKGLGYKRIADELNASDDTATRAGTWHAATVRRVLNRAEK